MNRCLFILFVAVCALVYVLRASIGNFDSIWNHPALSWQLQVSSLSPQKFESFNITQDRKGDASSEPSLDVGPSLVSMSIPSISNVEEQQGEEHTEVEDSPTSGSSPTIFSTLIPTVITIIRSSYRVVAKSTPRPNYFVYPNPSKANGNTVRVLDTQPTQLHHSQPQDKPRPTKHIPSTPKANNLRIVPTLINEELIDRRNREAFNRENNLQDEDTIRQQRQEIAEFLQQIRLARSLDRSRIQQEKEDSTANSSEEDELYSDKEHSVMLVEKKSSLEDEDEETMEDEKVIGVSESFVRTEKEVKKESGVSEEKEEKKESVSDEKEEENGESEEKDDESEEKDKGTDESEEEERDESKIEDSKIQRTTAPVSNHPPVTSKPKSSVSEVVSVPTKRHHWTKTLQRKEFNHSKQKPEKKVDISQTSTMKKANQNQKELSKSSDKGKTKKQTPSSPKSDSSQGPSTKTWTNVQEMERAAKDMFKVFEQDPTTVAECAGCRLFVGSREYPYTAHYPFTYPDAVAFSVTIIATSTVDRLEFIPYLLKRWNGNYNIAVFTHKREIHNTVQLIKSMKLPKRVRIILYVSRRSRDPKGVYPVNKLRNIAIVNVVTTHFLVMDMDMWPAPTLHKEISMLPLSLRDHASAAVIVPAFFLAKEPILERCSTILSCALESEKAFPANKTQLLKCLHNNMCLTKKKNTQTHMYIRNEWKLVPSQLHFARLRCFQNRFQEPYVMLRYLPSTPLFDERFVDYGCNKVQFIDNLRNQGYRFYIMTQSFAMDIAHHDSKLRTRYISSIHDGKRPLMQLACYEYMAKLDRIYKDSTNVTGICYSSQRIIYSFPKSALK